MAYTTAILCALALTQTPATKSFVIRDQGLVMEIPASWRTANERVRQVVTFPVTGGVAEVSVFATQYLQPAEDWQRMQVTVNEQLNRKIERQWDEEFLGVPMLFTRLSHSEPRVGDVGTLIGLLYARTQNKFHFRMVTPLAGYEEAETAWRNALLTLRTTTGSLPEREDGTTARPRPTPETVDPTRTLNLSSVGQRTEPLGPVRAAFNVSGRQGVLRFPKGATLTGSGPFDLQFDGVGNIKVEVFSSLDSPASGVSLMQAVNKELDRFTSVELRENIGPKRNRVGQQCFIVHRRGKASSGDLWVSRAVVDAGAFYATFFFESTSPSQFSKARRVIEALVERTGFEPIP